ncbi:MAG: ferrous iron transport protein B, partial [Bacteroidales bacterium]|nr:ferrous iron transport protein B [Bacteroidales bacterium]
LDKFGWFTGAHMPTGWWLGDMLVNGVIGGVGAVIAFMPNILILYFFISILEDSGYMARVAFITDKLMHLMGLHGKSFIPMIMGFGCNVPGIVATRSIGSRKSQLITLLIIPFVACAGRLPLFVLFAGAFFPRCAGIVLFCLYLFGILTAILSAKLLSRFIKEDNLPFVMELPPYRMPTGKSVLRHTWEKGKQYLRKTATTTLVFSLLVWLLGYFPHHPEYSPSEQLERSALGTVGKTIEPVMAPIGMDWKMGTGMIAGIGAKEVILSTLGVIYSSLDEEGDAVETEPATAEPGDANTITIEQASTGAGDAGQARNESKGLSALQRALLRTVTPAAALAFMVFILLYSPCLATFVAIKSETGKWSWAFFDLVYSLLVAWIMAFIVYRIALLL